MRASICLMILRVHIRIQSDTNSYCAREGYTDPYGDAHGRLGP